MLNPGMKSLVGLTTVVVLTLSILCQKGMSANLNVLCPPGKTRHLPMQTLVSCLTLALMQKIKDFLAVLVLILPRIRIFKLEKLSKMQNVLITR